MIRIMKWIIEENKTKFKKNQMFSLDKNNSLAYRSLLVI